MTQPLREAIAVLNREVDGIVSSVAAARAKREEAEAELARAGDREDAAKRIVEARQQLVGDLRAAFVDCDVECSDDSWTAMALRVVLAAAADDAELSSWLAMVDATPAAPSFEAVQWCVLYAFGAAVANDIRLGGASASGHKAVLVQSEADVMWTCDGAWERRFCAMRWWQLQLPPRAAGYVADHVLTRVVGSDGASDGRVLALSCIDAFLLRSLLPGTPGAADAGPRVASMGEADAAALPRTLFGLVEDEMERAEAVAAAEKACPAYVELARE